MMLQSTETKAYMYIIASFNEYKIYLGRAALAWETSSGDFFFFPNITELRLNEDFLSL